MTSIRALSTASLLGLLVALAGCSAEAGTASAAGTSDTARASSALAVAQATETASADASNMPHHGHHSGPGFLLGAALREPSVQLTPAQRTTIEGALEASRPAAPPSFDKTRVMALAAGIRAGKVDAAMVSPPSDDHAAHRAAIATALKTLHDTLTPDQRRALVDAVAKRGAERGPEGGARGEHAGAMGPGAVGHGPMGHLLEGLDLTKAQEDALRAKLEADRPAPPSDADRAAHKAEHDAQRAAMAAKLETFAGATFDANAFVAPPADAAHASRVHEDRFARELAAITSVLDATQREKLAAKIEAGPPARVAPPASPVAPQ